MKPQISQIIYQDQTIHFLIVYSQRQSLQLSVGKDCTVKVRSPIRASMFQINQWVLKNAAWILKKQEAFSQLKPRYVEKEKHFFLGNLYELKLTASDSSAVTLQGDYLCVESSMLNDSETTQHLLYGWYWEQAIPLFRERFLKCWPPFEQMGFKKPNMRIRHMRSRWGSLSSKGNMSLNLELIRAPITCIDYVIVHECCHIKHLNHGKGFYQLLSQIMPDWKVHKKWLNQL